MTHVSEPLGHPRYTIAALEDELVRIITSHNVFYLEEVDDSGNKCIRIKWDYLDKAKALIYKINICDPLPEFVIFTEDIPNGLLEELNRQGKIMMKMIITNAVRRIYESINPEYFYTNGT
jgi:hypothetical protein